MKSGSLAADLQVIGQLARGAGTEADDVSRLNRFYAPQAVHYDRFRERLLHGRRELIQNLALRPGQRVVELGAGTGRNLDFIDPLTLPELAEVTLVDICTPLMDQARRRAAERSNVGVVECSAASYRPAEPADRVFFSYSLSMMKDWRAAIDNAAAMLRPDGLIGAVDFYVSARRPVVGRLRHGLTTRAFWPRWFRRDGVHLGPEILDYLISRFEIVRLRERRGPVPYMPGLRVPFYVFVGRKR